MADASSTGMNGLTVARELKRCQPSIPIIMLSAYVSLPHEYIGATDAWIQKTTTTLEEVLFRLNGLLERASQNRATAKAHKKATLGHNGLVGSSVTKLKNPPKSKQKAATE